MANDLALILDAPVEDIVKDIVLTWNNEQLLEQVKNTLAQYENIVYDETSVGTAKKDRATLNAFAKALNDERIRIGKVFCAPYDNFKKEVDVVLDCVKSVSSRIDEQVKAFEVAKQEKKQNEIVAYFDSVIGDFAGLIPYERIHQSKWLNASVSMKSVQTDIDNIIIGVHNALTAIEALGSEDESTLKAFYFRTLDLSQAMQEASRLKKEREALAATVKVEQRNAPTSEPTAEAKTQTVRFAVTGTIEQLKALRDFLVNNKISYSAI